MFTASSNQSRTSILLGFPPVFESDVLDPMKRRTFSCRRPRTGGSLTDLCYFFPQFSDAFLDGLLHRNRVAEREAGISVAASRFRSLRRRWAGGSESQQCIEGLQVE